MNSRSRILPEQLSEFMAYLAAQSPDIDRIPPLAELSQQLGVSISGLREQLQVARALGVVEVKPKTGIRRTQFTFHPAVLQSLAYAVAVNPDTFEKFADFRQHVESAYFLEAAVLLTSHDHNRLTQLVEQAKAKLNGSPVQIPHNEHRELHMLIYKRLNNPFVQGILESYWEMYEAIGLAVYTDITYLQEVWRYHEKIVQAICAGDLPNGYAALTEHMNLLSQRARPTAKYRFE
jgi:DNA-binding FadR family transcriptional regulator